MQTIDRELTRRGIAHVAIVEPDPPYNGEMTAIGIAPVDDRSFLKPILARLPLLGMEDKIRAAV